MIWVSIAAGMGCNRLPNDVPPGALPDTFQKGMNLACWGESCYMGTGLGESLAMLQANGIRWVSVVLTAYQDLPGDSELQVPAEAEIRASLEHAGRHAREMGFRMTVKPHVDVRDGTWRGEIDPADRESWFRSYEKYLLTVARFSRELGVEQLVVGTELVRLSRHSDLWVKLIRNLRRHYQGRLLYAASWNEFESISFWDELDYAGINAFFPLTNRRNPALIDLLAGWEYWIGRMEVWQAKIKKPVVFTEIGYTSRDGTNMHPYKFDTYDPIDLEEQALCYRAALMVFPKLPWLAGVYWWYWKVDARNGPMGGDYPPMGKPAEKILRQAWGAVH